MDVQLPDGTILRGVPEGTTQQDIIARVRKWNPELGQQMLNATVETMAQPAPVDGPLDAAMIAGGRAATRLGRGALSGLLGLAGAPEAGAALMRRDQEEAELFQPVREQHPIASAVGESLPYFAVPVGAAGAVAGRAVGALPRLAGAGQRIARSPIADAALVGAGMGALDPEASAALGAAGGALGGAAGGLIGRAIRPIASRADEGTQRAVEAAQDVGIGTTAAQQTGSRPLGLVEASLRSNPLSAGAFETLGAANQTAANRIAAESIGESADAVTGEVLDRAARRIGDVFESVADEPAIALGDDFLGALARVEREFGESWTDAPVARKAIDKALNLAAEGEITGRAALDATQRLGKDARRLWSGTNADPVAAEALGAIKEALDDAIMASVAPAKAEALGAARGQWRNLLALERPGVIRSPIRGDVSPPTLANAMRAQDRTGFMRGRRDDPLANLAQVGKAFPAAVGDSGTASRLALPLLASGAGGAMAADDFMQGQVGQGAAQLALPMLLMTGAGRAYTSPLFTQYMSRGALPLTEGGRRLLRGTGARIGGGLAIGTQNNR